MQVMVKYVNFPKPGGKYGRIVTHDNQTIWVPPDLLAMFRAGMTADIGIKHQTWGQGETARQVMVATSGPNQGAQPGYGQQSAGYQNQARAPYKPNTGFQPRVIQGGGGRSEPDPKMIFVTGVVGRAMGSGKFSAGEIAVLAQEANRAYDIITRPPVPQPQPAELPPPDQEEPPFPEEPA